ncbi:DNA methyltransferase [Francisella tularensis]|nr:DNA methyltransferase [Francisella tularensis]MBK2078515.1 site-specific DNA-methyltransferase [Francisella tularensis subsp. mediasiatica]MBK2101001.1 site-specific DNA-methyltransferase [Francisella tularensis subsp. mediasiatica]MBK2104038.1 site-specific DNA-methyltransferase [Francisella tularensis subsp. mediasiatica]MDN9002705.1 DNA methyltransferase [Francisella tularensis subsp. mediasiatica]MDN9007460.1 DNA methyltransferase [Francisella tularensis subsp. mediasiatica]
MYPRLKIARELLKEDGVIFISIDDNEQANLKIICDEIFGEENFVGDIVWNGQSGAEDDGFLRNNKEFF